MSFRGCLFILLIIGAILFYFGKPQEWWGTIKRAGTQVHTVPADSAP